MNRAGATMMDDTQDFRVSLCKATLRLSLIYWTCMFVAERLRARSRGNGQFSSGLIAPGRYRASINLPWRLA